MEFSPIEELRFYVDAKEHSCVYRYEFTCIEPIDEEILAEAAEKATHFFPKYQMRPFIRKDGKGVVLLDNPQPVPIYQDDLPRALGTDETNGYLFCIVCSENRFSISYFHALGDGKGAFRFALHVLYFYMTLKGYSVTPGMFILTEEDCRDPDLLKPLEEYLEEMEIPEKQEKVLPFEENRVFCLEKEFALFTQPGFHAMALSAAAEELLQTVHVNGTTPLCLIAVLLARTFKKLYGTGEKVIRFSTAVELRNRLNSRSQREFGTYADLYYLPEWDELPLTEVCANVRREIEEELSLTRVKDAVMETMASDKLFKQYFDLREPDKIREVLRKKEQQPVQTCAYLSSTGMIRMPDEIKEFLSDFQVKCTPSSKVPNLFLYTLGDRFTIQISDNDMDGRIEKAFCDVLRENGIMATLEDFGKVCLDYLGNLSIETCT